jgi:hypothetical protein
MTYCNIKGVGALLIATVSLCTADQPRRPRIVITSNFDSPDTTVLQIHNGEQCRVDLRIVPGPLSSISFPETTLSIPGNSRDEVSFSNLGYTPGPHVLHVLGHPTSLCTSTVPASLYEPLKVTGASITRLSYEQAFLDRRVPIDGFSEEGIVDYGQGYVESAPVSPSVFLAKKLPEGATLEEDKDPFDLKKLLELKPGTLPSGKEPVQDAPKAVAGHRSTLRYITGHWALQVDSTRYINGWGFTVKVWQNNAGWRLLGSAPVGFAGHWTANIDSARVVEGRPLVIEYVSQNRFVRLQDPTRRPYAWGHESDFTDNVGSWYADLTVTGDLPSLHNLMRGAHYLWDKFVSVRISPLRDEPIRITYPNSLSSGECIEENEDRTRYAWSCSYSSDGRIYLIADHAGDMTTVQHEIAHSIHAYYWRGGRPAGAGGPHSLGSCYNSGLALSEGFANFIPYWVQFYQDVRGPRASGLGYDIETPGPGFCMGPMNEVQVSAAFWDMYDMVADATSTTAVDNVFYVDHAKPIVAVLGNPRNSMVDYLALLSDDASAAMRVELSNLFRLNTLIP